LNFFGELKRRNVFRVAVAYVLAAWVLLQVVDFVLEVITAPDWILQVFFLAALVGLPVVLVFSWVFEMTPEGVKRESAIDRSRSITSSTGRKLDRVIIVFLAIAVVLLLADRFLGIQERASGPQAREAALESESLANQPAVATRPNNEKSIAVLPFVSLSSGQDDEYFADGLTEEILNSLSQLPELLVTARTSAFYFKGKDIPIQDIAAKLGVGTVVEGSVRRSGERLRVTAQLIRATDGFHLWSENYDSTSEDTITVQEGIAEKIATAMNVVLDADKREAMRRAGLRNVEAFIAMQKGQELYEAAHGGPVIDKLLGQANVYFERVLEISPQFSPAFQLHSDLFAHRLMAGASGKAGGVDDPAEVEESMLRVTSDFENALQFALTLQERNNIEMDLAFISGDWRGMPTRLERYSAEQGCAWSNWVDNVSLPFGFAKSMQARNREFASCDPLSSSTWVSAARTELWAGDAESALQIAQRGSELAPGESLSFTLVSVRVALGQYEEAEAEVTTRLQLESDVLKARLLIAAARDDRERVGRLLEQYSGDPDAGDDWKLIYLGWAGDREQANQVAARMDQHAFGSQALSTVLLWCMCGSPWNLEATPNFASDVQESGLLWPPVSPIKFPMQDW